jgi:hypothetical protein
MRKTTKAILAALKLEPCLALGDQLRLEAADPVARDRNRDLAILRQDPLRARPVAVVAAVPRPAGSPFS